MKTLLFPGWASFKSFYEKELLEEFFYAEDNFEITENEEVNVIAWSMGTLKALEFIKKHKVNKLILMAPTSDFTKTTDKKLIDGMIDGIGRDKKETLNNFYRLNFSKNSDYLGFMGKYEYEISGLDSEKLVEGLRYLRDTKVEDFHFDNVKSTYVITGKRDKVIPLENSGEFFSKGNVIDYNLGHNFIYGNSALKNWVRSMLSD